MRQTFVVSFVSHYLNDISGKNDNYTFVFVKVIPKTLLVPFFFRTLCTLSSSIRLFAAGSRHTSVDEL